MRRSTRGFIAAAIILLSYPLALAVEFLFGGGAPTVIHFVTGAGFVLFATSVFDFGLPRWVNVIGAAAAGAFGAILLMQGISDVTSLRFLQYLAFDVLGQHVERLLPDVVYLWFIALIFVSKGKSRMLGGVIMLVVVGAEIATLVSLLVGTPLPSLKVVILLPFVWLLVESAKKRGTTFAPWTSNSSLASARSEPTRTPPTPSGPRPSASRSQRTSPGTSTPST